MEDALFATMKEKSTDFTNINDLIQIPLLNSGDIFIIYDDTVQPPMFRTAILESITNQEESFKTIILNFKTVEGEQFILRKFYKGTIDVFSPLIVLGGELFDKYKLFKVENHSIGLDQLVEKFKKLVKNPSIVFNSSMPIVNQPKTGITGAQAPEGAERSRLNSVESQSLAEGGRLSPNGGQSLAEGGRLSPSGGRLSPKEQAGLEKRAAQIAKAKERELKSAAKSAASSSSTAVALSAAAGVGAASAAGASAGFASASPGSSFKKVESSNKQKYIKYKNKYINLKNDLLN